MRITHSSQVLAQHTPEVKDSGRLLRPDLALKLSKVFANLTELSLKFKTSLPASSSFLMLAFSAQLSHIIIHKSPVLYLSYT